VSIPVVYVRRTDEGWNSAQKETWMTTTGYAKVNGLEMYYEVHGTGRPLVLLHGGLLTIDLSFGAILPALAATRQVIAVELQGHGHTAVTEREMSLENLADDIVALLDHLGIDKADLFGFSLGGLTSLQLAMRHPSRVGQMIVASAHYRPDGYYPEIGEGDPTSTRMPTQADFQEMREAYLRVAPHPEEFELFMGKTSGMVGAFEGWKADELRAITAPTLLVLGDHDFVRVEHAAEMHDLIPGSQLAVLPSTTHMGVMTRTDLLLPMVEVFLN
jgi:pimeloyl-ACP methyl ester carboxylesterase